MLEIFDITPPISETMVIWPGLTANRFGRSENMNTGDAVNVTDMHCCAHIGLHVDAQCHHIKGGVGIEKCPAAGLMGSAYVMDLTGVETAVDAADLEPLSKLEPFDILLLKTKNSTTKTTWKKFDTSLVYITAAAVERIKSLKIKGVVADCLTFEEYGSPTCPTHKALLKDNDLAAIEGADLRKVEPGHYWFVCLPLPIVGSDAGPARAVLIRDGSGEFLRAWRKQEKKYYF
jgi:arylformamidase